MKLFVKVLYNVIIDVTGMKKKKKKKLIKFNKIKI